MPWKKEKKRKSLQKEKKRKSYFLLYMGFKYPPNPKL